jgi:hypothetical protein
MQNPILEIQKIHERNKQVVLDKKWETSLTRKITIAIITYVLVLVFLKIIHAENAALAALVPTGGYWLSTITLKPIRKIWEKS